MKVKTYGVQLENMKEYRVASTLLAAEMDRDTAGKRGYLNYFDGSAPKDTSPGYCYLHPVNGMMEWVSKKTFEEMLLTNDPWVKTILHSAEINKGLIREVQENKKSSTCRNCTQWSRKYMYCNAIETFVAGSFGCVRFQRKEDAK